MKVLIAIINQLRLTRIMQRHTTIWAFYFMSLKNYPEAEKEFRTAIKINPDYAKAHYNLGNLLRNLKNYPEAEKEYRTAIKINPDYAETYYELLAFYFLI